MSDLLTTHLAHEPFKFVVEDHPFYLHSGLISEVSESLDKLMNDSFNEAKKQSAVLEDVTIGTFTRFSEWLYTDSYHAPNYAKREIVPTEIIGEDELAFFKVNKAGSSKKKSQSHNTISRQEVMERDFLSLVHSFPIKSLRTIQTLASCEDDDSYGALHCHAQVYQFADMYNIESLKKFAARNLHTTLSNLDISPNVTKDLTSVIRYLYEHTIKRVDETDDIRTVLRYYMGWRMSYFLESPDFRELLAENNEVFEDFLDMVGERIKVDEK